MKCPLILMAWLYKTGVMPQKQADCFKEECAWWNGELEACAMVALVIDIGSLAEILSAIGAKLPQRG